MTARVTVIGRRCPVCQVAGELTVSAAGLAAYKRGAHVQHAFPELSGAKRELLITGLHGTVQSGRTVSCWKEYMGPDPDDPDLDNLDPDSITSGEQ